MPLYANTIIDKHLGLIAYGGNPRQTSYRLWTEQELLPLVVHDGNAVRGARYYDGFIFEPGCDRRGGMISPRYLGMAGPASKDGWQQAADALFAEGRNMAAVMNLSRQLKPWEHVDCWAALPYPQDAQWESFGSIQGQNIAFSGNPDGRLAALIWWVRAVESGWCSTSALYPGHRCRMRGFVWVKNSMDSDDRTIVASLAKMLDQQRLKLMWCANYGTSDAHLGEKLGFHQICLRPTFTGSGSRGQDWIKHASDFASEHKLGLVVWEPAERRAQLDAWLTSLHEHYAGGVHVYEMPASRVASWHRHHHPYYGLLYRYMHGVRNTMRSGSEHRDEGLA
ncbi:DUF4855 domain-containing protein [Xylanibacillus composti]|uniref:Uncharacterized protein n=1 Tax=Xylanibacillus composti TaxID=1572762 RepID=A0A8J4H2T6_9BACL|nr:DUF4855 domain-containing protein [Xylanibacillus composti]MDT9723443.1 DUF4855 domain-containing protein [Xylanibacillus composti]GIQ68521.1 hypothetical protein XYCOK13_13450 [Xylanibacillus composti]